jgi:hypothetical protein
MTPDEQRAYIGTQMATIAQQEQALRETIRKAYLELHGLTFARQAYQDVLNELDKRAASAPRAPSIPRREREEAA